MTDTIRTLSALITALTASGTDRLAAQDLRDFLVSMWSRRYYRLVTTTPVTLTTDDSVVDVDTTAGAITINLPALSTCPHHIFTIIKKAGGNNVVVDPNGSETINGASTNTISTQYNRITIIAPISGTDWRIID